MQIIGNTIRFPGFKVVLADLGDPDQQPIYVQGLAAALVDCPSEIAAANYLRHIDNDGSWSVIYGPHYNEMESK